jgi:pimeloyl-ACP methyl ester carboxylesterase
MPAIDVNASLRMHYEHDDFTDPWTHPDAVLLIHGASSTSLAWFGWVPHLARQFRVIRPDLRGYGRSSIPEDPQNYPWSLDGFADDLAGLLDALNLKSVHVVGAKLGGSIAMKFAATHPDRTRTLSIVSSPARSSGGGSLNLDNVAPQMRERQAKGLHVGRDETMLRARFGTGCSEEQTAWWRDYAAQANQDVTLGIASHVVRGLDISGDLRNIRAPTLILTSEGSKLQSVEAMREYQRAIPDAELQVLPGDGYFLAAIDPDGCARRVLDFILRKSQV